MKDEHQTIWIGSASIIPLSGSDQESQGLKGGYGFVAIRAGSIEEAVNNLKLELAEGGSDLVGFEWLSRLDDYDRELSTKSSALVDRLEDYPVQFDDFHWYFYNDDEKPH